MNKPVIVSAVRLPSGRLLGTLSRFTASDLGGFAIKAAIERANVAPEDIDEAIMGHVLQAGCGQNHAPIIFDKDETIRDDTSVESLAKLRPVFQADGSVTAGNAPGINDSAAAVLVTSEAEAEARGLPVMGRIVAYATSGIEPELVMMAPVDAVNMVLDKTGWDRNEVDFYELNEAFSVQAVAVVRELGIDPEKVNVRGGAVALGHPIGASGARILTTLLYTLADRGGKRGIAGMCLEGGNALALAVERS